MWGHIMPQPTGIYSLELKHTHTHNNVCISLTEINPNAASGRAVRPLVFRFELNLPYHTEPILSRQIDLYHLWLLDLPTLGILNLPSHLIEPTVPTLGICTYSFKSN